MPTFPQRSYSPTLKRDHEWLLAWKALRLVMYLHMRHVERGGWTPVPIAASKGARLLGWSDRTWRRAVAAAEAYGWLDRQVRPGRVKGNPRGYNPGSLYMPRYRDVPMRPTIVAPRLNRDRIQQTGQDFTQPGQDRPGANSEPGQHSVANRQRNVFHRPANLPGVLSKEREGGRDSGSAASPPLPTAAPEPLEHPSPTPSLKGRGDSQEGIPADVAAAVRAIVGPPLTDEQRARYEREHATRLRTAAEAGNGD